MEDNDNKSLKCADQVVGTLIHERAKLHGTHDPHKTAAW